MGDWVSDQTDKIRVGEKRGGREREREKRGKSKNSKNSVIQWIGKEGGENEG